LAEADLILGIGLDFEPWLSELVQAAEVEERWIKLGETMPEEELLRIDTDEGESDPSHEEEHGQFDPHIWQDPALTGELVTAIAAAFSEADPGQSADYQARAETYAAELEALDAWIVEQLVTVPSQQRRLVTSHDALGYFAARYGFTIVGSALGHSTETASPSAQDLARLVEDLQANPVPALFGAFGEPNMVLNQIAEEAGIPLVLPLYADSLGPEGSEGATYLDMMRYNIGVIAAALSP
jgi:ABC-type Zn uptake system ZnuABC Zn-binding protein ZnuA